MTEPHPGDEVLRAIALAKAEPGTNPDARRHLRTCGTCRTMVAVVRTLERAASTGDPCPEPERIVEFVDATPAARLASVLHGHLTGCVDCAADVERLHRLARMPDDLPGAAASAPPPTFVDQLRALVSFEMPQQIVLATRGGTATTTSPSYQRAMDAYRCRRYPEALRGLEQARDDGDQTPSLNLYLGACLLNAQRTTEAVEAFRLAVRARPRLAENRWYLAQALLLAGRGDDALSEFDRAAAGKGPHRDTARDISARLRTILERP